MPPRKPRARHGWQALIPLSLTLVCAVHGAQAIAESPFPGQTFTYSHPPLDVAAATAGRDERLLGPEHLPIVVKSLRRDPSEPAFIFFSTGNDCRSTDIHPVIAVYQHGVWNTIEFPEAKNHYWTHVYPTSPYADGRHMYAVSRYYCGEPGGLYIYHSADAGRSWTVSTIKMHYLSRFLSLRMEPNGTGEIIVESDNDPDPVGGHHVYRTFDWGYSWSEPEFSETILLWPARRGEYSSPELNRDAPSGSPTRPLHVPITTIMESIAAEHAQRLERERQLQLRRQAR